MFRRVFVPLDGSTLAEHALVHAAHVAAPGGEIVLVQVVQPEVVTMPLGMMANLGSVHERSVLAHELREAAERTRQAASTYLEQAADRIGRPDVTVRPLVLEGQPASRIVDAARAGDLIVMSTHGRTGLTHLLIGSVAERVVRHATVPVLVVRRRDDPPAGQEVEG